MVYNILLAGDGSESSFRAAAFVARMMRLNPEVRVTVLSVFPAAEKHSGEAGEQDLEFSFIMHDKLKETVEKNIHDLAETYQDYFSEQGLEVSIEHRFGDPAERICRYAERRNFDLVAVGTRGLKGFEGLVLGSVAHKVVHLSKIPVLLVR